MQECQGQESEKFVVVGGGADVQHPCELISTLSTFSTKPSSRPPIRRNPQDLNNTPSRIHPTLLKLAMIHKDYSDGDADLNRQKLSMET